MPQETSKLNWGPQRAGKGTPHPSATTLGPAVLGRKGHWQAAPCLWSPDAGDVVTSKEQQHAELFLLVTPEILQKSASLHTEEEKKSARSRRGNQGLRLCEQLANQ